MSGLQETQKPKNGRQKLNHISREQLFYVSHDCVIGWIFGSRISQIYDKHLKMDCWPNGKASDYESGDCRFDPCVVHLNRVHTLAFIFACVSFWFETESHMVNGRRYSDIQCQTILFPRRRGPSPPTDWEWRLSEYPTAVLPAAVSISSMTPVIIGDSASTCTGQCGELYSCIQGAGEYDTQRCVFRRSTCILAADGNHGQLCQSLLPWTNVSHYSSNVLWIRENF